MHEFAFAVPGDLATPTGGYAYDRRMIAEVASLGWQAQILDLGNEFPRPSAAARAPSSGRLFPGARSHRQTQNNRQRRRPVSHHGKPTRAAARHADTRTVYTTCRRSVPCRSDEPWDTGYLPPGTRRPRGSTWVLA